MCIPPYPQCLAVINPGSSGVKNQAVESLKQSPQAVSSLYLALPTGLPLEGHVLSPCQGPGRCVEHAHKRGSHFDGYAPRRKAFTAKTGGKAHARSFHECLASGIEALSLGGAWPVPRMHLVRRGSPAPARCGSCDRCWSG